MRKRFTKAPKRAFRSVSASKSMRRGRKIMASEFWGDYDFTNLMKEISQNIIDELTDGRKISDVDDAIREQLDYETDRACTYYADCLNIIAGARMFDWKDADYNLTTVGEVAAYAIETAFYDEYFDDVRDAIEGEV